MAIAYVLVMFASCAMVYRAVRACRGVKEREKIAALALDELQGRIARIAVRVGARPPRNPDWARKLIDRIHKDIGRVLGGASRTMASAQRFLHSAPHASEVLIEEAAFTLDVAESMLSLAEETVPAIVAEERRFARDILEKVRVFRGELETAVRRHIAEGLPFEDARMRIGLMRNALEADASVIDHDPRGALDLMGRQLGHMECIGGVVAHLVSLRDHILELGRTLPPRVDDAETAFAAAHRMLADLKAKRSGDDWSGVEEVLRSLPGLFESVRGRIRAAVILCRSDPGKLSEALAEAAAAENVMATIDGRLLAVMETWSEHMSGPSKGN